MRIANKELIFIRLLSLFSGIGAWEKALQRCNIHYELVNYCEIDKYASKAYSLIHNVLENLNLGDICTIDTSKLKNIDMITYSFPCTDISIAGKKQGFIDNDGNITRSGLFFEALRIITDTKPKFAICENVKGLTNKKFQNEFDIVLDSLNEAGYNNYYQVLNAKNYGVPQNRERVFIISIRKDIDNGYSFPLPYPLKIKLRDILEETVDESFYLSDKQTARLQGNSYVSANRRLQEKDYCDTLCARDFKDLKVVCIANIYPNTGNPQAGRIYDTNGISPSLDTCQGGNRMPKIVDERIRKLTPKECFRLMDFDDDDYTILHQNGISNSQIYKMAGNSVVVNCLVEIFKELKSQYSTFFKD